MNGSPSSEAIRDRDPEGGQLGLGLALQDLEAGLGAELEQLAAAGQYSVRVPALRDAPAMTAGRRQRVPLDR